MERSNEDEAHHPFGAHLHGSSGNLQASLVFDSCGVDVIVEAVVKVAVGVMLHEGEVGRVPVQTS